MPVAGIGSRFVALLIDYAIWLGVLAGLYFLYILIDPSLSSFSAATEKWATAIVILIPFVLYWGYFTLFEAFWNGRTPGKRVAKIRVIQKTGRGIGLFESMVRNLLRVVDQFPFVYAVGVVSIFLTRQHQRLGDLAAGTLVVHEQENLTSSRADSSGRMLTAGMFEAAQAPAAALRRFDLEASGLQRLEPVDLEVLEGFFARRLDFSQETRERLANRIAGGIYAKSGLVAPEGVGTEEFLEETARQLRDLSRLR